MLLHARWITLLGTVALFATACSAKETNPPTPLPAAVSQPPAAQAPAATAATAATDTDALTRLATNTNKDPVANVPASAVQGVAEWDVHVAVGTGLWIVGWDTGKKNVVTWLGLAASVKDDQLRIDDIVFGAQAGTNLTLKQVLGAYLSDARALNAGAPAGAEVKPSSLFYGQNRLLQRYCGGLNDTMDRLLSANVDTFTRVNQTDTGEHCMAESWWMPQFLASTLSWLGLGCHGGSEVPINRYSIDRYQFGRDSNGFAIPGGWTSSGDSYWQCAAESEL